MNDTNTQVSPQNPAKEKIDVKKEIWEWVKSIAVALIVVMLIRTFLFTMIRVDGRSMVETLHDNDRLAVTIIDMKLFGPSRGDIVICTYPGEDHLCVKRVIGMPGDMIEIRQGYTYINGELLEEEYIVYPSNDTMSAIAIPENHYFVMGDNRSNSKDSRDPSVGTLSKEQINGRAQVLCWPLDRFHKIENPYK